MARHKWKKGSGFSRVDTCEVCGCIRDRFGLRPVYRLHGMRSDEAPACSGNPRGTPRKSEEEKSLAGWWAETDLTLRLFHDTETGADYRREAEENFFE